MHTTALLLAFALWSVFVLSVFTWSGLGVFVNVSTRQFNAALWHHRRGSRMVALRSHLQCSECKLTLHMHSFSKTQIRTRKNRCKKCLGVGRELPIEPRQVIYIREFDASSKQVLVPEAQHAKLVGFDAEWKCRRPNPPIAVLQLAFPDTGAVYVIHVAHAGVPTSVRRLLKRRDVLKVGFSCTENDVPKFQRSRISLRSAYDVQSDCAKWLERSPLTPVGLSKAAHRILGFTMAKGRRVSESNWERKKLTEEQIRYAAMDAWVTLRLYLWMLYRSD